MPVQHANTKKYAMRRRVGKIPTVPEVVEEDRWEVPFPGLISCKVIRTKPFLPPNTFLVGVDPGATKMGMCVIDAGAAYLYELRFPSKQNTVQVLSSTRTVIRSVLSNHWHVGVGCVEGAAYGAGFGQAKLAESKSASILTLIELNVNVHVLPPLSIYKRVFGSSKVKSKEYEPWAFMEENAASALACALCALGLENG